MNFLTTLSHVLIDITDTAHYLKSIVWTELTDNSKYRLHSVVAFSTAWIEFSHSFCLV